MKTGERAVLSRAKPFSAAPSLPFQSSAKQSTLLIEHASNRSYNGSWQAEKHQLLNERLYMKAIVNGTLLLNGLEAGNKTLLFDDRIVQILDNADLPADCESIDAQGMYVSPGLVDLHVHGYQGEDVSDGSEQGLRVIAGQLLKNGVTAFLPTIMTISWDEIEQALCTVRTLMPLSREGIFPGSEILGVHMEGPFINPARKGAQSLGAILRPDADRMLQHKDIVRIVTMAPEMPGGLDFIRQVRRDSDIIVSIGHSDASFELTNEAVAAGASYVTHLFNAMSGLNHRGPGIVGAALNAPVTCELIADTFHVHPGLFGLLAGIKGNLLILVTDCTRAGGLGDGEYTLGGQKIYVNGIQCRLADGTIAGSVLKLNQAVRNLRDHARLTAAQAVQFASLNAAKAIDADDKKGSLEPGKDADIVLFDRDFNVRSVYVRGILKYAKVSA